MSDPVSSVRRFGVSMVGPKFRWAWLDGEEVKEGEFRARHSMSFEQLVEYNSLTAFIQAEATMSAKHLRENLEGIDNIENPMDRVREITQVSNDEERARWTMIVEQTLMLVAPSSVEEIRPHLESANPNDVRDLRDYLKRVVIDRLPTEVLGVAQVDPTLPPPPADSPATVESGDNSDSEA